MANIFMAIANFLYGIVENKGFEHTAVSWTGFFFFCIIYKIIFLCRQEKINKNSLFEVFFGRIYNYGTN